MPSVGFLIGGAIVVAGVAYFMYKNYLLATNK